MGLLDRAVAASRRAEKRFSIDQWLTDFLLPANEFGFNGHTYPFGLQQTFPRQRIQEVANTLPAYAAALRSSPPAFAAQMFRAMVISQVRFTFRRRPSEPVNPRKQFGNRDLRLLERPWPNATTGELVSRMEWHAGLAGNSFVYRQPSRLRVLRPDFTAVVYGSDREPEDPGHALDGELVGYVYQNGGLFAGNPNRPQSLPPSDVSHWSPIPDPESPGMGMSWVTAALNDIRGDAAATAHKLMFFANGATPNLVVKGIPAMTRDQFDEVVEMMEANHSGLRNAYKTLYLVAGADATVVGADLKQLDFKQTQGAGETRIALLGRVPAPLLGISEGLAGSSLNAGNFGMARRIFADGWLYPTLTDLSAALSSIVRVPDDAELWFDTTDIPLLREDGKDAAEIESTKAMTIRTLVDGGFTPESVVAAVQAQDMALLKHTGKLSVQLQEPGSVPNGGAA